MRSRVRSDLGQLAIAPAIGFATAITAYVLLSALAQPTHFLERTRALNAQLAQAQSLLLASGDASAYPAKALCRSSPDQAALEIRQRVQSQAAISSVALADIAATPQAAESLEPIAPVTIQFSASARYEQIIGFLGALAKSEPQIFADTIDLRPDGENVELTFAGMVLCSDFGRQ